LNGGHRSTSEMMYRWRCSINTVLVVGIVTSLLVTTSFWLRCGEEREAQLANIYNTYVHAYTFIFRLCYDNKCRKYVITMTGRLLFLLYYHNILLLLLSYYHNFPGTLAMFLHICLMSFIGSLSMLTHDLKSFLSSSSLSGVFLKYLVNLIL